MQTTWLTSPTSTKYHLNKEGGLLEYSRSSRNPATARHTSATPPAPHAPEISEESSVIVGLFHDIGNMGMPGKPYYLLVINDGMPTGAYNINPGIIAMGLPLRSLYLVS